MAGKGGKCTKIMLDSLVVYFLCSVHLIGQSIVLHLAERRLGKMADDGAAKVESSSEPTSKTIVLVGHGGYDKLKIQNMKRPTPGKGQILLNVKRSGINFSELMCRQGLYDQGPKLPAVLGIEAAGIVAEVGEEASKFKVQIKFTILKRTRRRKHVNFHE